MRIEYKISINKNLWARSFTSVFKNPDRASCLVLLIFCFILESFYRGRISFLKGEMNSWQDVTFGGTFSALAALFFLPRLVERLYVHYKLYGSLQSTSKGAFNRVSVIDESGITITDEGLARSHHTWRSMTKPKRVGPFILMTAMNREIAFEAGKVSLEELIQKWEKGQNGV